MIPAFEKQTKPLTSEEREKILPLIVSGLSTKIGASKIITAKEICEKMTAFGCPLTDARLRKIISFIRMNDIIPGLVSKGKGYFVATKASEIDECINSLQGRVDATQAIIEALRRQKNIRF